MRKSSLSPFSKGFTLIEIIMAMAILAIGIIGVVRLLPAGLRASKSAETMSKVTFLAQEKIEQLKLDSSGPLEGEPLEGEQEGYSWVAHLDDVSLEGVTGAQNVRRLNLTVSWKQSGRTRSHEFVTYIGGNKE